MADSLLTEFQQSEDLFCEYYAKQDFKSLIEFYTEDCRFMPPGSDTIIGREGAIQSITSLPGAGIITAKLIVLEVVPCGDDYATERGTYTFFNKEGKIAEEGKYVALRKKINKKWLMYIDIFNSNKA